MFTTLLILATIALLVLSANADVTASRNLRGVSTAQNEMAPKVMSSDTVELLGKDKKKRKKGNNGRKGEGGRGNEKPTMAPTIASTFEETDPAPTLDPTFLSSAEPSFFSTSEPTV